MPTGLERLSRQDLSQALCERIIPQVKTETAPLVLAPLIVMQAGAITKQSFSSQRSQENYSGQAVHIEAGPSPLLRATQQGRTAMVMSHWVQEGLNAGRYPVLIYVQEGAAHFRIGVTWQMAEKDKTLNRDYGRYLVMLPTDSFLLIPPNTPISDASRPHWEGESLEQARSRLVWFHILPDGVSLHTCSTRGAEHTSSPTLFVSGTQFLTLIESTLEELRQNERHAVALSYHYLLTMLLHVERGLSSRLPVEERFSHKPSYEQANSAPQPSSSPVQRACRYMEAHLSECLILERIATHSYISGSYLNRLFRAELKMTVAEYLTQLRLQRAQQLLKDTDLPVQRIGTLVGYPHPEHFNRLFSQRFGMPPGAFRRQKEL